MPASITLNDLSYATPGNHELFNKLNLTFNRQKTGLIGRNGVGKSTLFKLIMGELAPNSGSVSVAGTAGILRQSTQLDAATVADQLGIASDLARLFRLEAGAGTLEDAAHADWTLPDRMASAIRQMGLPDMTPNRPIANLSGGQRTRLALAALVLAQPDFVLLDEPTNNMDADGRDIVTRFLMDWRGGAIVISHDRALLGLMDAIVELTSIGCSSYGGNWDQYAAQKALELAAHQHDLDTAERQLSAIDRKRQVQAERQDRKNREGAKRAKRGGAPKILLGGLKERAENTSADHARLADKQRGAAIDDLQAARDQIEVLTPLTVSLNTTALPLGRTVVTCTRLTGGTAPDVPLIHDLSFSMTGPERVGITGPNGVGKSTLLRLLTGELRPQSGSARIHCTYALLDQTASLLDPDLSIRDNFRALNPDGDENVCRAALARFMFRAGAALQTVKTLSGGELLRAALAATIGGTRPPELLILDEPTNHLDIYAIQAVEAGLSAYDGAILVVSHDPAFLENIGVTREITLT
ncbi:ABC-F family ATP-binding cassette domain-containing protein [Devosia algicola]|uniref:ABC-F family ATP-binding cassette domain-containing protein n=1 Tax=Devosia algicola TaxID=3026418 RepID=A0ABY7YRF0_9HYPH|nr:ABC-F family ATP-binding cassette domain-containing protein [Devosia algicola]WDR03757.1 ABC-F family ATP-binding cassette domain-containing protein [Devosia algicola]